ncbi:hypothetical protein HYFRA_00010330 [Hymenoscyphus fraxineus]|uniref:Uncharacterized protein n=1 Tax=Hymenoscyphus fraxineus TaxID=746836 RepID=A0A9N9KXT5_9HELO|nr:hypothetical protein HYFRA_00010330 [Hymenoscyphus fraxineus]
MKLSSFSIPRPYVVGGIALLALMSLLAIMNSTQQLQRWKQTAIVKICRDPSVEITTIFTEHDRFMSLDHADDSVWDALLTPNGGFFKQPDSNGKMRSHGISMFHQLHCLQMIRAKVQMLTEVTDGHPHLGRGEHDHILNNSAHWLHCFDYIRQGILCAADSTVETPEKDEHGKEIIAGKLVAHQCRNARPLYELSAGSGGHYQHGHDGHHH